MARLFFVLFAGQVKEIGELVCSCIYTAQLDSSGVKTPHGSFPPPCVDKADMPNPMVDPLIEKIVVMYRNVDERQVGYTVLHLYRGGKERRLQQSESGGVSISSVPQSWRSTRPTHIRDICSHGWQVVLLDDYFFRSRDLFVK